MKPEMSAQLLEEILEHLRQSQGGELEKLIKSKQAPAPEAVAIDVEPKPEGEDFNAKANQGIEDYKKGLVGAPKEGSIDEEASESPAVEAAEGGEDEMSDEELEALIGQYLKK